MKQLLFIFIGILLIVSVTACESKKNHDENYQVVRRLVKSQEIIKNIKGIINYEQYVLIFTHKNKIYGLDTETALISEYDCNLNRFDEFIVSNNSVLMASRDSLYSIKVITENEILFKKHEYRDGDSFSLEYRINEFDISSCCFGEWGGSVYFKDSVSKEVYSTESTCLINVDTLNGEIYLFNYLGHNSSSVSVCKIGDVRSLPKIEEDERCNWYYKYFDENYENIDSVSSALLGNEYENIVIFDTIGFPIHYGFITGSEVKLVHSSRNALSVFSITHENKIEIERELVTFEDDQRIRVEMGQSKNKATIGCSNLGELKYIINIDKNNSFIELFEIN